MAEVTRKVCDIYGVPNQVYPVRVCIECEVPLPVLDKTVDMCPKAMERLKKYVERGLTPPKGKKGE